MTGIPESVFDFLNDLKLNNSRTWFAENKTRFNAQEQHLKHFYEGILEGLQAGDAIETMKIFRIYKDVRFSKNKLPYNIHRSVSFSRSGAHHRGGYYLRLEPGNSILAGGFFAPEPADLLRIRKEFEQDDEDIRKILKQPNFKAYFGGFDTSHQVKTAPRGFDKTHPAIDLIRNKNFIVMHPFTDKEVLSSNFGDQVIHGFGLLRPFFDYMSEVLTTDLNGISLLD